MPTVHLLDYVAGNERSLVNAIQKCGYTIVWISSPADIPTAQKLIVPGVGHFGHCLSQISTGNYTDPIKNHIQAGKPYLGICVGMQALFASSAEDPATPGFSLVPGSLARFDDADKSVPHIGWNSARPQGEKKKPFYGLNGRSKYYYVHSYALPYRQGQLENEGWNVATARYGKDDFVGAIGRGNVLATQFHPEKSGAAGLRVLKAWLDGEMWSEEPGTASLYRTMTEDTGLTRRIIACLDVRTNDAGDIVVTKGDQYDVKEKDNGGTAGGAVRNLGKPVEVAKRYYEQGADEITFLNITAFRNCPLKDLPMLEILRKTSETVFVPLTIGGGIKDTTDLDGKPMSALQVARLYFKAGADKVSIGGDAVLAAEEYYERGKTLTGRTGIETISAAYGNQAVVVSVDPKKVFVDTPEDTAHHTFRTRHPNDAGQEFVWYQCTIKGGRERRDLDVRQLVQAVKAMGCGEILLNSIDKDGTNSGFDLELIADVKQALTIPVIASSGAGKPEHFRDVFLQTATDAALGAGMFHRGEFTVEEVKECLAGEGLVVRPVEKEL